MYKGNVTLYLCPNRHPDNWTLDFGFDGLRDLLRAEPHVPTCAVCGEELQKVNDVRDAVMLCPPTVEASDASPVLTERKE